MIIAQSLISESGTPDDGTRESWGVLKAILVLLDRFRDELAALRAERRTVCSERKVRY